MRNENKLRDYRFFTCNSLGFPQVYQVKGFHKIVILNPAGFS